METQDYLLSVINNERRSFTATLLRGVFCGLSFVYVGGLKLFLLPYHLGIRKQTRLGCPVISIGNLSVGGTGKTPITQLVCERLKAMGLRVCVLNRGYKGKNEFGAAIVSDGKKILLKQDEAGDEATMLAEMLPGVSVVVGKDRRVTGKMAIETFNPDVIVLDDGMQFYQLHRDLDVVLLDSRKPFENGWTFPRGLLREPPSHLRRAGSVIISNSDKVSRKTLDDLRGQVAKIAPQVGCYESWYAVTELRTLHDGSTQPPEWLSGRHIAAFCALGNPDSFFGLLEESEANVVLKRSFADHHKVTIGELNEFIAQACREGAEAIVVSEKDAVKLPPIGRPLTIYALCVRPELNKESEFLNRIVEVVKAHGRPNQ